MLMLRRKAHLCLVTTSQERQQSSIQILNKSKIFYFPG
jgi:hypothetical protein